MYDIVIGDFFPVSRATQRYESEGCKILLGMRGRGRVASRPFAICVVSGLRILITKERAIELVMELCTGNDDEALRTFVLQLLLCHLTARPSLFERFFSSRQAGSRERRLRIY
jgi:hypothetical protein